jgi:Ca2+-binding EF-hand superfamily protein
MKIGCLVALVAAFSQVADSQDYAEFARDHGMQRRNNAGPLLMGAVGGVFGTVAGTWWTTRKLKKKHSKEKKDILHYMQAQDEIYKNRESQWQAEYKKLYKAYEQMEKETLERDYEEFKAPDANGDDMISRAEFNTYVRKYLSSFPELSEKDFPKFEEFDLDGDGIVSFQEWQRFLQQQKLKEAQEGKVAEKKTGGYNDLLNQLYEDSATTDSFNSLNQRRGVTGGRRI